MNDIELEKEYSKDKFIEKLRRLADCLESNENFRIMVKGEAIYVPDNAEFSIEFENSENECELEFQMNWKM
jgi:amphi-Trp domain-containing protein